MTLRSRLKGAALGAYLGADGARHALADLKRRVTRSERAIDFYFDIGDPASYLAAQAAQRLFETYQVPIHFHLVSPPAADVDPAPNLRLHHALRDGLDLARKYDVDFPGKKPAEPQILRRAAQVLMIPRPDPEQLRLAIELAHSVWKSDVKEITHAFGKYGNEQSGSVAPYLATAYGKLRDAGHYQGSTFAYGGDWYVGIDRLSYLEDRLRADTGITPPRPAVVQRADYQPEPFNLAPGRATVDFFFSFRSPYSYLALSQLKTALADLPADIRLRPVLPMVTRGLPMPRVKTLYIARDAKREADRLGIPFGNLADPLGKGVDHALAITYHLLRTDPARAYAFTESAARGTWSEALDLADYVDLKTMVERAGVDWTEAKAALADEAWKVEATDAAADLNAAGLWGVPSFKAGDYATWGQDRIGLFVERLKASLKDKPAAADHEPVPPA